MPNRRAPSAALTTWLVPSLLLASLLTLSACNTVSGFGRDVESAGDTLSDTAEDVQD